MQNKGFGTSIYWTDWEILAIVSEKHEIQSKNKSVKYQVKINDIIRYMDANNLVHIKDKIIDYTSFERPWIAVQTKIRITSICWTISEILALVLEKWDISSKKNEQKKQVKKMIL